MSYLRKSVSGEEDKAVTLSAGTAEIGKLAAGTAEIGKLAAGTAAIGKLAAGTAAIGSVTIGAGTAAIGALGGVSQPIASWTVTATGDDQETITATKAASSGVIHYVCGILVSADYGALAAASVDVKLQVSAMSTTIFQFRFTGTTQKIYDVSDGPQVITFPHPIACAESQLVKLVVDGQGSIDAEKIDANMWGFSI